jgi:hypothetical protein
MQARSFLTAISAVVCLTGCGTYTVASTGAYLASGRTITDWAATGITGGDCRTDHVFKDKYVCEMPVTYNQSGID